MEKKENKVVKFVKDHKKEIVWYSLGVLGTVVGIGVTQLVTTKIKAANYIDIPKPELPTGECIVLYKGIKGEFKDCICGFAKDVDICDLGNFGDALATVEGIDPHEHIRFTFGTERSFT